MNCMMAIPGICSEAWEGVDQVTISEFRRRELADLMGLSEEAVRVFPTASTYPGS
jgi:hypothetical protein